MKKITALLLLLLTVLLSFASCKDAESTKGGTESATSVPKETVNSPTPQKPTPTPIPTPTPTPSDDKKEENPLPFGLYKITDCKGRTVGYDPESQLLSFTETTYQNTCFTVESYPQFDENGKELPERTYVLFGSDAPKESLCYYEGFFDEGEDLRVVYTNANDPQNRQRFRLIENEDGTFSFKTILEGLEDRALCVGENQFFMKPYKEGSEEFKFKFEPLKGGCSRYKEWISKDGIITLRLGPSIMSRSKLSNERLQQFANDMETVYKTYKELTNWAPYQHIIFKGYEREQYPGYVIGGYMVISADKDFMYTDLKKMYMRDKAGLHDFNFLVLHEMGHMFDWKRGWKFEAEAVTDIKLGYVLFANKNAVAAPSEHGHSESFNYTNIDECYDIRSGRQPMNGSYDVYRTAYLFVRYGMADDWEAMKKTYQWFNGEGLETFKPKNDTERLEKFVEKLSEYSGKDVKNEIGAKEWNVILARTKPKK